MMARATSPGPPDGAGAASAIRLVGPGERDRRTFLTACIAEELAFASRRIEALGSELADDPVIAVRHAGRLQDIAGTVEVLGHLTRLLSSDAPEEELAAIGMTDLRRRLERAAAL